MKQILIVLLLLAAAVLMGLLWFTAATTEPGPVTQPVAPVEAADEVRAPVAADAPVATPAPQQVVRKMKMPDGSELAPLNGLTAAPNPAWDAKIPYVPPVRVETDPQGKQWYVFPDGSQIGTYNVFRGDLQKWEPITEVRHPKPVQPVLEENIDPSQVKKKQ